jgi:hypothetical protein
VLFDTLARLVVHGSLYRCISLSSSRPGCSDVTHLGPTFDRLVHEEFLDGRRRHVGTLQVISQVRTVQSAEETHARHKQEMHADTDVFARSISTDYPPLHSSTYKVA